MTEEKERTQRPAATSPDMESTLKDCENLEKEKCDHSNLCNISKVEQKNLCKRALIMNS